MRQDLRQHVLQFGHNATSYQTLNPDFEHVWVGEAVVGYVRARAWPRGPSVWVAAGAPIGPASSLARAAREFSALASASGARTIWFGVEPGEVDLFPGCTELVVGSHPVWDPRDWPDIIQNHSSVRAQIRRAANKGVVVQEMPAEIASSHPQIRRCLAEWISKRGLPPLRFLTDPHVLDSLGDRRVFVATREDAVVAYALLAPIPARSGWLIEWIIQGQGAPNGTPSLLLDSAFQAITQEGATWATLGLAALSSTAPASSTAPPLPVRALLAWARAHAQRFYNFEGLELFKAKFRPLHWEPIRLVVEEPAVSLRALYALADAFSGQRSPIGLVSQALSNAARDEARLARRLIRSRLSSMRGN